MNRLHTAFVPLLAALILLLAAGSASAQNRVAETQARAYQKKAMEEDYLATNFTDAEEKLTRAIAICTPEKCPANLRSLLYRDLGVVEVGGQIDKDKGIQNFAEALKIDPNVQLDPDIKTKELNDAFDLAHKKAGVGSTPTPAGDFQHTPPPEQLERTAVPIYIEYTGDSTLVRVIARYKGFGMTEFKPIELHRVGNGWGAEVACLDVQQGMFQYFIQGFDADNDPVATGGDRAHPYKIPVKTKIEGPAPHLPGQPAPTQCRDTGDCPPGFPCHNEPKGESTARAKQVVGNKLQGDDCEDDVECKSGICKNTQCTEPIDEAKVFRKYWAGISVGVDFIALPSGQDVCKVDSSGTPINTSGYFCTNTDHSDYPTQDQNAVLDDTKAGSVNGGIAPANVRILATFDYALNQNMLVGGRIGFVTGGYNGEAAHEKGNSSKIFKVFHIEARYTYLFGKNALSKQQFAPYVFGAFGFSEFAASVKVPVFEEDSDPKDVKAWAISGPMFVSVGGGIRYAFNQRAAIMFAPLKANVAFLNAPALISLQPELGVQVGF